MSENEYVPGTYAKGDVERVAGSARDAVALVFDGYRLKETSPAEGASYRDLQKQAKELGIPANQSEADLRSAIAESTISTVTTVVEDPANDED